jgi:hypothetical protein
MMNTRGGQLKLILGVVVVLLMATAGQLQAQTRSAPGLRIDAPSLRIDELRRSASRRLPALSVKANASDALSCLQTADGLPWSLQLAGMTRVRSRIDDAATGADTCLFGDISNSYTAQVFVEDFTTLESSAYILINYSSFVNIEAAPSTSAADTVVLDCRVLQGDDFDSLDSSVPCAGSYFGVPALGSMVAQPPGPVATVNYVGYVRACPSKATRVVITLSSGYVAEPRKWGACSNNLILQF